MTKHCNLYAELHLSLNYRDPFTCSACHLVISNQPCQKLGGVPLIDNCPGFLYVCALHNTEKLHLYLHPIQCAKQLFCKDTSDLNPHHDKTELESCTLDLNSRH